MLPVQDYHGGKHGIRQAYMMPEQWLGTHIVRYNHKAEKERFGMIWSFETSKYLSKGTPHSTRPHILTCPSSTNCEPRILIYEPISTILFQNRTLLSDKELSIG